MTPLAARTPYTAAAAASFNIEIDSMSSGFKSERRNSPSVVVSEKRGTPSITNKGEAVAPVTARILSFDSRGEPGSPVSDITDKPAT